MLYYTGVGFALLLYSFYAIHQYNKYFILVHVASFMVMNLLFVPLS